MTDHIDKKKSSKANQPGDTLLKQDAFQMKERAGTDQAEGSNIERHSTARQGQGAGFSRNIH